MSNTKGLGVALSFIAFSSLLLPSHAEHERWQTRADKSASDLLLSMTPFSKKAHTLSQKADAYNFSLRQAVDQATKAETAFAEGQRLMDAATDVDANGVHQNNLDFEAGSPEAKSLAAIDCLNAQDYFSEAKNRQAHCVVTLLFAMRQWEVLRKEPSLLSHYHLGNNLHLAPYVPKELESKGLQNLRMLKPN